MIESMAYKLAVGLKKRVPNHPSSVNVFRFTIAALINAFCIITLTLLISFITNKTTEVLMILISFAALRAVSGGIHLKSGDICVVVTTLLFTTVSFVHLDTQVIYLLNAASVVLAYLYAPSRIENQSRIDKKHYPKLKYVSILIIATNFLIMSSVLAVTLFVQSLLLIKLKGVKN